MKNYLRLTIKAKNYPGISNSILKIIYNLKLELDSVEVIPGEIRVKIESIDKETQEILMNDIFKIKGVMDVWETPLLESEFNKRKFSAVINSVDDGIIVLDKSYIVKTFNEAVLSIFGVDASFITDKNISSLTNLCPQLIEALNSRGTFSNITFAIKNNGIEKEYIAFSKDFIDDNGIVMGTAITIKSSDKTIELANLINLEREGAFKEIIGNSPAIKSIKNLISIVAKNDSTILLRGDSGTGKELFARALQSQSNRRNSPFLTINCAAIPDSLMESELFGYAKGSFTGALSSGKTGLFEESDGGTLFLDEVGELSLHIQAKLLRVLQEGKIRKIGSNIEKSIDVRIIAATNKNIEKMVEEKLFREDLYYRLNVIPIHIPPLKDRRSDIPDLVSVFINKFNKKLNMNVKSVEPAVLEKLMNYSWKGNVRELENVIERSMNLCSGKILKLENLMIDSHQSDISPVIFNTSKSIKLKDSIEIYEKIIIKRALLEEKSYRKTAKLLGISHTALINKVKKYEIT